MRELRKSSMLLVDRRGPPVPWAKTKKITYVAHAHPQHECRSEVVMEL